MKLTIVGSGSKGNCYVLHNDREALMIEAGVRFADMLGVLGAETVTLIKGCIVSHEHGDHAKFVHSVLDHGIPTYATSVTMGTFKKPFKVLKPTHFRLDFETQDEDSVPWLAERIGGFTVLPFRTVHDAASPCGFYIYHIEIGCLLFATDTRFIPNTFKNLTNIMIECNYDEEMLKAREDITESVKDRIRRSHQSVTSCVRALKANDLSKTNFIVLIHISEGDGDPEAFVEKVSKAVMIPTVAARKGDSYEISQFPVWERDQELITF